MGSWKEEDFATPEFIQEYLKEFREGVADNPQFSLSEKERQKVDRSLKATQQFCLEMVNSRKSRLFMHDLILMAVGFYGGFLTAQDSLDLADKPNAQN
jgi:hypothetical protein